MPAGTWPRGLRRGQAGGSDPRVSAYRAHPSGRAQRSHRLPPGAVGRPSGCEVGRPRPTAPLPARRRRSGGGPRATSRGVPPLREAGPTRQGDGPSAAASFGPRTSSAQRPSGRWVRSSDCTRRGPSSDLPARGTAPGLATSVAAAAGASPARVHRGCDVTSVTGDPLAGSHTRSRDSGRDGGASVPGR